MYISPLIGAMVLAVIVAAVVVVWLTARMNQSMAEMSLVARKLAQGDYGARVLHLPADKRGELGSALNVLAKAIQSQFQELSQEKMQVSSILSNMVEAVVAVDASCRIVAVNPALCALFGVEREEALGKPFLEALRHNQIDELLRAVLKSGAADVQEARVFAPDERLFEVHSVPLGEGKSHGALVVMHDITRLRKLEQMRRDFVANVSHELRTPLSSLKGFVETLRSGVVNNLREREEFLEEIEKSANRLAALIDDLMDLSAIESGRRELRVEAVPVLEVAREAADSLKPLAERMKVSVIVKTGAGPLLVRADRGQVRQVLVNLIQNAVKFNKEGGAVTVSARAREDGIETVVCDTGMGIPQEDIPRIFERFYRVEKARSRDLGGTGLGLAIAKHILESHGGKIEVESRPGQGSIFRFLLPSAG